MSKLMVLSAGPTIGDICETTVSRLMNDGLPVKLRRFSNIAEIDWRGSDDTPMVVVCEFAALPSHRLRVRLPKAAKHLVFKGEDLPLESLPQLIMSNLKVHSSKRLHIVTRHSDADAEALIFRTISGFGHQHSDRIIDAWWEGDEFVILTPDFTRFPVSFDKLSVALGNSRAKLARFQIDPDGSFVFWPHADVHLGWEQFVCLTNDIAQNTVRAMHRDHNVKYGERMRLMRDEYGLRQSDIHGLTPRQVGRIEKGESQATRKALSKFAHAHKMPLVDYLRALAEQDC